MALVLGLPLAGKGACIVKDSLSERIRSRQWAWSSVALGFLLGLLVSLTESFFLATPQKQFVSENHRSSAVGGRQVPPFIWGDWVRSGG